MQHFSYEAKQRSDIANPQKMKQKCETTAADWQAPRCRQFGKARK